ncbi:MAG: efflux RND transporter permease subunit [Wujia sp.]|nr:efflux RND transporter permease subunit [Wujia sp.]MCI6241000.1 efflux RND transporter permease subunit [Clostridium sp.]MDD7282783.1 efflux RND transporter permease subunit [Clostridium sp.]MDY3727182.1 efflux RND transporter permease subunit [Wujia sp.]
MIRFGKWVVKHRSLILIIGILLLIPSAFGYFHTRVNYDILNYLPDEIDTMKGQEIMVDEFGTGAFSMCVVEGMSDKDISKMRKEMCKVDGVKDVLWYDSFLDLSVPVEMLPDSIKDVFINKDADSTILFVLYPNSISADETMDAIENLRKVMNKQCYLSGMSAVVTDTKNLSNKETPIYVLIAVILSTIVLALAMDSAIIPVFFLISIGMAIVYNLGTNVFKGEISYVTQALAAVLQLGVTMDYSIFLWHSYEEKQQVYPGEKGRAMAHAISNTISSVVGSSITTVAGFIALCFMSFTLGMDLGVVMAKGVVFGVICCVTVLPSMILIFDNAIEKTKHKVILPNLSGISKWVTQHFYIFLILFFVLIGPAVYGYTHNTVYYDLAGTLPESLESITANNKLEEQYHMGATHMVLLDANTSTKDVVKMTKEMEKVDGVKAVLGLDSIVGSTIPKDMLPDQIREVFESGKYKMLLIMSEYKVASDEVNEQCDTLKQMVKDCDENGMLIGEAPCTKDLIEITDEDFKMVSAVSIGVIFIIIAFVFKSISLPIILVAVIEFAIFINMGIPTYTKTAIPFIASIVIGTIQLGATVDYAILMTNKYKRARHNGLEKKEAVIEGMKGSVQSIIVSALSFFAATFGVGMYSNIDMISSLCTLMARGALISMVVVILLLPTMFMIFDKVIIHTSAGFINKEKRAEQ